jgi:phage FluMu protein Com
MQPHYCHRCKHLLLRGRAAIVEIKCPKCGHLNYLSTPAPVAECSDPGARTRPRTSRPDR